MSLLNFVVLLGEASNWEHSVLQTYVSSYYIEYLNETADISSLRLRFMAKDSDFGFLVLALYALTF